MRDPDLTQGPAATPELEWLFCTGCGKVPRPATGIMACPSCGDRLIPQGFCPVCEHHLRQPVGTPCPKHEIPLEAGAPARPRFDDSGKPLKWATVARYSDSMAAEAPRIRLEAEGIPTFVAGERMGARSMYHVATGGVELKVPDSLATDARIILSQTWSATAAELDLDETVDDDVDVESDRPAYESRPPSWRDRVTNEILIASIVVPLLVEVAYLFYSLLAGR
jgi:hypothetical protein